MAVEIQKTGMRIFKQVHSLGTIWYVLCQMISTAPHWKKFCIANIKILRNMNMVFPDRVVFPEGVLPDRFHCMSDFEFIIVIRYIVASCLALTQWATTIFAYKSHF